MMLKFFHDEHGATAIEYALIASLIAMAIVGGVTAVGDTLKGAFEGAAAGLG